MKTAQYYCIECGRPITRERHYAHTDCVDCAMQRMLENNRQLRAKRGPYYEKWRRKCIAAAENYKRGVDA
jgi:DNA-directed RNA polymerase subunit RPC12/RpoP